MVVPKREPGKRAATLRSLCFPVCTIGFSALGYVSGALLARGKDPILAPQVTLTLLGLFVGLVVAAFSTTVIDVVTRRK
jgi:hypothetical protein